MALEVMSGYPLEGSGETSGSSRGESEILLMFFLGLVKWMCSVCETWEVYHAISLGSVYFLIYILYFDNFSKIYNDIHNFYIHINILLKKTGIILS